MWSVATAFEGLAVDCPECLLKQEDYTHAYRGQDGRDETVCGLDVNGVGVSADMSRVDCPTCLTEKGMKGRPLIEEDVA